MNYVISDIHGCYSEFLKLLEKISFSEDDHLYILGDVLDRGFDPIGALLNIMNRKNVTYILGNHDFLLYSMVSRFGINLCDFKAPDDKWDIKLWLLDGGIPTMDSFLELPEEERWRIAEYLCDASLYEVVENNRGKFILSHAGIDNFEEEKALSDYELYDFIYCRMNYYKKLFEDENTYLVTGHTPTPTIRIDKQPLVFEENGYIAIDCGCVFGGKLAAYCLDTGTITYVDKEEIS